MLDISSGIDEPGIVKWDLALCLLLAWLVVFACISKGVKSSGKVGQLLTPIVTLYIMLLQFDVVYLHYCYVTLQVLSLCMCIQALCYCVVP